jgi:transposase-like protein
MPWRETGPMQERLGLVLDVLEGRYTVAEACQRRNVSPKTGFKYLKRSREEGLAGLGSDRGGRATLRTRRQPRFARCSSPTRRRGCTGGRRSCGPT